MAWQKAIIAIALLLATVLAACDATLRDVTIATTADCANGAVPTSVRIYNGEDFYICGSVDLNGDPLLAGTIRAFAPELTDTTAAISEGRFSIPAKADTPQHRVHYIQIDLKQPCNASLAPVAVEIKTTCVMLPPSSIEAVPNVVTQGSEFTLQVKNPTTDVDMSILGLTTPIFTRIDQYGTWTQSVASDECSALGSCVISFQFTDSDHPSCQASSSIVVSVRTPDPTGPTGRDDTTALLAITLLVMVLGIGGAVALNRFM